MSTPDPTPPPTEPREMTAPTDAKLIDWLELHSGTRYKDAGRRLRARSELAHQLERLANELAQMKKDDELTAEWLTEHAEAAGVDPDRLNYVHETTKAIIQQYSDLTQAKSDLTAANERLTRLEAVAKFMDTHWHDYNQFIRSDSDGFTYRTSKDSWMEANTFVAVVEGAMKYAASTNNGRASKGK